MIEIKQGLIENLENLYREAYKRKSPPFSGYDLDSLDVLIGMAYRIRLFTNQLEGDHLVDVVTLMELKKLLKELKTEMMKEDNFPIHHLYHPIEEYVDLLDRLI
ncbi:hypothetical protein KO561_03665 [Radiobacillus kanasensis]|uniref:hypothetical protein n=1 Tax=Radiobacillus kanasensis TaxID=2844358 RepID=UPI001E3BB18E|nr:hypothetical protein [Radiobacillus kanasensis]UFU00074.1 hypothetical protein KO561_03665 [Radiobacillus kanasensis]